MKKFPITVIALFLMLVPIHSLSAGTDQTCPSQIARLSFHSDPLRYISTSMNKHCQVIPAKGWTTAQLKTIKIPAVHIYNNREGTWTQVIPLKTVTVTRPSASNPKPVPAKPTTPTPKPAPAVVPAPATTPTPTPAPTPAPASTDFSAMQKEMLGYINDARAAANLAPLTLDQKLCQGAYLKSQDMAVNGYFSHTSPTYGSPFEMMKSQSITYRTAGENIAKNTSVIGAHTAFMNSAGHKANILNQGFGKVGLGFYQEGQYLYVTQWFTN